MIMKSMTVAAAAALIVASTGLSFAQGMSKEAPKDPVQGSGSAAGAANLDGAGTKAATKDKMVAPKAAPKMDKTGASANPVDGSGSAKGAENLDPAGTKAAKKDAMVPDKKSMGPNSAGAKSDSGNGGDGGGSGK
jgi:hypothetical protein